MYPVHVDSEWAVGSEHYAHELGDASALTELSRLSLVGARTRGSRLAHSHSSASASMRTVPRQSLRSHSPEQPRLQPFHQSRPAKTDLTIYGGEVYNFAFPGRRVLAMSHLVLASCWFGSHLESANVQERLALLAQWQPLSPRWASLGEYSVPRSPTPAVASVSCLVSSSS